MAISVLVLTPKKIYVIGHKFSELVLTPKQIYVIGINGVVATYGLHFSAAGELRRVNRSRPSFLRIVHNHCQQSDEKKTRKRISLAEPRSLRFLFATRKSVLHEKGR